MLISRNGIELNWNLGLLSVSFLGMVLAKRVIGALILFTISYTPLWTVTSLNTPIFLPSLNLRGRVLVRIEAGYSILWQNGRDPKEQVDNTTVTVTKTTVLPPTHSIAAEQEVTPSSTDINDDVMSSDNVPRRYELTPRSTRGIPPRRYGPEFESQRS